MRIKILYTKLPDPALPMIDKLLSTGLYGDSREDVIARLVCNQLITLAGKGLMKLRGNSDGADRGR